MLSAERRLLVAEDDAFIAFDLEDTFTAAGFAVTVVNTLDEARRRLAQERWDGVVIDASLGGLSARELGETCGRMGYPLVVYSGRPMTDLLEDFPNARIVTKPASSDTLTRTVRIVIDEPDGIMG